MSRECKIQISRIGKKRKIVMKETLVVTNVSAQRDTNFGKLAVGKASL